MAKEYDWPDEWYRETIPAILSSKWLQQDEYLKCSDGWDGLDYWLSYYVVTQDEHDQSHPFKAFPYLAKEYLQVLAHLWYHNKKPIFIPKSRQLMVTWIMCACVLWDSQFNKGRRSAIQSKMSDDADALLERIKIIWEHQPPWIKRPMDKIYCQMYFPETKSVIQGIKQGPDKLRQYTFSNIISDEMGFQYLAERSYMGSSPTIKGGGRFIAVSSANPGFFEMMVMDELEMAS